MSIETLRRWEGSSKWRSFGRGGTKALLLAVGGVLGTLLCVPGTSQDQPPRPKSETPVIESAEADKARERFAYIGMRGCRKCHMKQTGDQYRTWKKSPHAHAYETLKGEPARKVAAELGLGDPWTESECLRCHVTGYGEPVELTKKIRIEDGVSCESCHGPGEKYQDKKIHFDRKVALENGFVVVSEAVCVKCHNDSAPNFKGFDYEESVKKIQHPIPEAKRRNRVKK